MLTHKQLKERALARADVKTEYERLNEELPFLMSFFEGSRRSLASLRPR